MRVKTLSLRSASRENAQKVLDMGGVLMITPGGDAEALRSYWNRNRLELNGRSVFVERLFDIGDGSE